MRSARHHALMLSALLLVAGPLAAAPVEQRPEPHNDAQYGDRQAGSFGDTGAGYWGNPGEGNFASQNFRRDQEGSVTPVPGTPNKFRPVPSPPPPRATEQAKPQAEPAVPYVQLKQPPADKKKPPKK